MRRYSNVLWAVLTLVVPATAQAQIGFSPWNPCGGCRPVAPPPVCNTCMPRPVVPVTVAPACPQVSTTYRQEQYTTYRPVARTEVEREAVAVNVPVTTHKQVTVDEGGYKMVWVPNMVTKTVAETTMQRQVQYRDVAYQVVENVPQVHTRLVPEQTVAYRPTATVAVAPSCCGSNVISSLPVAMPTQQAVVPQPQVAAVPTEAPTASTAIQSTIPQQAAAPTTEGEWVQVPQRTVDNSPKIELQSYQQQSAYVPRAQGMFSRPTASNTALRTGHLYQ